jgi:hypothetical protein
MTLSRKQMDQLTTVKLMIENDFVRRKGCIHVSVFKPNQLIFSKLNKNITVWAQNAPIKSDIDHDDELNQVLIDVASLSTSRIQLWDLLKTTTKYNLERCQFTIISKLLEENAKFPSSRNIVESELLPVVRSYWVMMG